MSSHQISDKSELLRFFFYVAILLLGLVAAAWLWDSWRDLPILRMGKPKTDAQPGAEATPSRVPRRSTRTPSGPRTTLPAARPTTGGAEPAPQPKAIAAGSREAAEAKPVQEAPVAPVLSTRPTAGDLPTPLKEAAKAVLGSASKTPSTVPEPKPELQPGFATKGRSASATAATQGSEAKKKRP